MRRRLSALLFLALAASLSFGALDCLQLVAWTKMFVEYRQAGAADEALELTLDASRPCGLCCEIREARHQQVPEPGEAPPVEERLPILLASWSSEEHSGNDPPETGDEKFCRAAAQRGRALWQVSPPSPPPRWS